MGKANWIALFLLLYILLNRGFSQNWFWDFFVKSVGIQQTLTKRNQILC